MKQQRFVRGGLAVLAAASAWMTGTPAYARATVTQATSFTPIELVFDDDCTGEEILVEGFVQSVFTFIESPSGRTHVQGHSITMGIGEGLTSGIQYVFQSKGNDSFNLDLAGLPLYITTSSTLQLVAQGPTEGLYVRVFLHQTISASGVMASSQSDFQIECR